MGVTRIWSVSGHVKQILTEARAGLDPPSRPFLPTPTLARASVRGAAPELVARLAF